METSLGKDQYYWLLAIQAAMFDRMLKEIQLEKLHRNMREEEGHKAHLIKLPPD